MGSLRLIIQSDVNDVPAIKEREKREPLMPTFLALEKGSLQLLISRKCTRNMRALEPI